MNLSGLLSLRKQLPAYQMLLEQMEATPQALFQAARPYVAAGLKQDRPGALLFLTARSEMAQQLADQFALWLPPVEEGGPPIYQFAEPDALPFERIAWGGHTRQQRLTALSALQGRSSPKPLVIASARALMQKTLPARELRMALRPLKVGGVVRLEQMTANWVQTGYNPVDTVEEPGTFARRGGIVDIWPPNLPDPIRIDLFGDEVETLRLFDPATQRSHRRVESIEIGPGSEALSKYGTAALARLGVQGGSLNAPENQHEHISTSPLRDPNLLLAIREEIRLEVDHLTQGHSFHGIEWYLSYFYEQPACLLDYLEPGSTVVVDDGLDLFATLAELDVQVQNLRQELIRSGELPHDFAPNYFSVEEIRQKLRASNLLLLGYGDLEGKSSNANTPLARSFAPGPRYGGKTKQIVQDITQHRTDGHAVVLLTRQAARLQETLRESDILVHVQSELTLAPVNTTALVQGVLGEGFIIRGLEIKRYRDIETERLEVQETKKLSNHEDKSPAGQEAAPTPANLSISQSLFYD